MIVAHLFTRESGRKGVRLMCETTATKGLSPVYGGVTELFPVKAGDCPSTVVEKAKRMILADRPDLEFVAVLRTSEAKDVRSDAFDMTFRPRRSLLDKLGIKRK